MDACLNILCTSAASFSSIPTPVGITGVVDIVSGTTIPNDALSSCLQLNASAVSPDLKSIPHRRLLSVATRTAAPNDDT